MLSVTHAERHLLALYAECRYAECHYAKSRGGFTNGWLIKGVNDYINQEV
jgi:hypothetical protein